MAWVPFDSHKLRQYNGNGVNFASGGDTLKVMLCTATYSPVRAAHDFKDDVTNEVSGSNYTAGGNAITKSLAVASNILTFDCLDADLTWLQHASGFTNARIAVLYKDTGTPSTSPLIAYYDLGSDKGNVSGDLVLQSPTGIFTV